MTFAEMKKRILHKRECDAHLGLATREGGDGGLRGKWSYGGADMEATPPCPGFERKRQAIDAYFAERNAECWKARNG